LKKWAERATRRRGRMVREKRRMGLSGGGCQMAV